PCPPRRGLLLPAGHISPDDPRGPWKAYRLDGAGVDRDGPVTATVAWHDRKSDLAVLNFESPHRRPDDALVIPLGRMPSDARLDAEVIGFPRFATERDAMHGWRRVRHIVHGKLNMQTGEQGFPYLYGPEGVPKQEKQWKGFSGALVFVQDTAVGVVTDVSLIHRDGVLVISLLTASKLPAWLQARVADHRIQIVDIFVGGRSPSRTELQR